MNYSVWRDFTNTISKNQIRTSTKNSEISLQLIIKTHDLVQIITSIHQPYTWKEQRHPFSMHLSTIGINFQIQSEIAQNWVPLKRTSEIISLTGKIEWIYWLTLLHWLNQVGLTSLSNVTYCSIVESVKWNLRIVYFHRYIYKQSVKWYNAYKNLIKLNLIK